MPEAKRKEMNSPVSLVSEEEGNLHLAPDFMSLFSVPVLNNDLQSSVWIKRRGLSAQVSSAEVTRKFLDTLPHSAKPGVGSV